MQADMDRRREKAEALSARAFALCRDGKLSELQALLASQEEENSSSSFASSALSVKLSDRQNGKGKDGATMLHM